MDKKTKKDDQTGPLSKLMLCVVLALGTVLILADTGTERLKETGTEHPAEYRQVPAQTETAQIVGLEETEPKETETLPAVSERMPSTEETSAPTKILGSADPVEYEIIRWDRSYVNSEGKKQMTYYFDYPVLHSEEEAHKRINEAVYRKAEAFMTEMTQEEIETPVMSVFNTLTDCIYTMESQVCHNGEGILSLMYTSNYYMGGNHSIKDRHAVTYSLRTGEEVNLTYLTDMDEENLLDELQIRAYDGLYKAAGPMLIGDTKEVLAQYTLDDFKFLIQEGEIVLLFDTYEFTAGAAGPQFVETGLYLTGT